MESGSAIGGNYDDAESTVTSEWYDDPRTLVTFPYRIQTNWAKQIPSNPGADKHVIFIDPSSNTFISSYMNDCGSAHQDSSNHFSGVEPS